jgi:DNA polymerase-1
MAKATLFLIDGHALCYRCFYAIKSLRTSKGQPTNAVYGFVRIIRNILRDYTPDYMAVCFDSPAKTRRQERFAAYKIQRPPMPDDLRSQIPVIKEVTRAFRIPIFEVGGAEADDIIATISRRFAREDSDVVIVSDDKDMFQLAGKNIKFFNSKSDSILDEQSLNDKLGFEPRYISDFIGLVGDKSDNIPGVKGIGEVYGRQLINEFGNLENILEHMEGLQAPKAKEKLLLDQKEAAKFSKELAVLDAAVPVDYEMEALKVRGPDNGLLYTIFQNLEFRKLAEELTTGEEKKAVDIRAVKDVKDIEALISRIQTVGCCALTIDGAKGESLFGGTAVYIALDEGNVYEVSEDALSAFKLVFENKKIIKIVYNLKEALRILSGKNMTVEDGAFDIMLAGYLLGASPTAYELANLAWTYLGSTVSSDQKSADEAKTMIRLYPLLVKELHDKSLVSLLEDIEMPLARVLFTMEANGVALDLPLLKNLSEDCAKKIDELTAALYMMAEEKFNLNSPKQLGYILFDKLKLPGTQKTKTGFSTNESVLTALAEEHIFPSLILEYRQLSKLKSTYIDALPKLVDPETGRLHARFNQTGTETGRLSSSQPNLQNIPARTELGRQIRKSIIASPKGWRLVAADYSQIELRVLAHLSGDANLLKAFNEDEDIHAYTASLIFDKAESDVTPRMRNYAKRVNFGIVYGMSAFGLAKDLKVPQVEAQAFIDKYFLRYPAVKRFMGEEIKKCEEKGYVLTILNRRRYIPEINSSNMAMRQFAQRQAINTPVQGSAADLMKLAMIDIHNEIKRRGLSSKMISTVHDELVFEVPEDEQREMTQLIRGRMEGAVKLTVPVKVSVKVGDNWLEMEEI